MDDHVFNKLWVWGISWLTGTVSYIQVMDRDSAWRVQAISYIGRLLAALLGGITGYIVAQMLKSLSPNMHWGWEYLAVLSLSWRGVKGMDIVGDIMDRALQALRIGAPNSEK